VPTRLTRIIARLEEQEKTEGKLPALLGFYRQLLEVQNGVGHKITVPNPLFTREEAKDRALKGQPLIGYGELAIDWALLRQGYRETAALYAQHADLFGELPAGLLALTPGRVVNARTVRAWYAGRRIVLPLALDDHARAVVGAVFASALKPFLEREAEALKGLIDQETWRRGYCPLCGGNADFASLARDTGARWLLCARCDTEWLFQRLQCPYCGNADQNRLSFFAGDSPNYRLYVCEACHHYLKAIDLRQVNDEALLPLERVMTIDLDMQAQEKGYSPCA
jgi:hypothetical protein